MEEQKLIELALKRMAERDKKYTDEEWAEISSQEITNWTEWERNMKELAELEKELQEAEDRLGLLTPILKGVLTDYGFENAVKAQQVFGGHGYIKEWGMEQIVRDARIAQIYEGSNGIQALDLVARKLPKNMGRAVRNFFDDTEDLITKAYNADLHVIVQPLTVARNDLRIATEWLLNNAISNPNNAGSASYDYMKLFGLVLLGFAHIRICMASDDKERRNNALYFMERILPETYMLLNRIKAGSDTMMKANFDV